MGHEWNEMGPAAEASLPDRSVDALDTEDLELAAMEFLDACRDYMDAPEQDAPLARRRYLDAMRKLQAEAARAPKLI